MGIEVRPSARRPPETYEQWRHIAPALKRDAQRLDAMVDVHPVLERVVGQPVRDARVLVYLPPGVHPDHVLERTTDASQFAGWDGCGACQGRGGGGRTDQAV